jgi:hypothetical protein
MEKGHVEKLQMTQIIVDAEMMARLNGLCGPLEFCDAQGHVLGRFVPSDQEPRPDDLEPDISYEELRRRSENFQGRPLSDLLAEWEKRK